MHLGESSFVLLSPWGHGLMPPGLGRGRWLAEASSSQHKAEGGLLLLSRHSVLSHWWLEITYGGIVYTTEMDKCYTSWLSGLERLC